MIQKLKSASDQREITVDGSHGWTLADYVDREPIDGEFVEVEQCFAIVRNGGMGLESVPEPVRITKITRRPGAYWGAQHPAGSYDFHERCRLSHGRRLVQTHSSEAGFVRFHNADSDQSGVREIFRMRLWGQIVGGRIVPV